MALAMTGCDFNCTRKAHPPTPLSSRARHFSAGSRDNAFAFIRATSVASVSKFLQLIFLETRNMKLETIFCF